MTLALVLGGILALACVVAVALPYLREPDPATDELHALDDAERARLALLEERDRALAALKELEADHRAGRIDDADYRASVGPLRREAAEALRRVDEASAQAAADPDATVTPPYRVPA